MGLDSAISGNAWPGTCSDAQSSGPPHSAKCEDAFGGAAIFHNAFADRAAPFSIQSRSPQFWQVWDEHVTAVVAADKIYEQVFALQLAVGRGQAHSNVNETGEPAVHPVKQTRELCRVLNMVCGQVLCCRILLVFLVLPLPRRSRHGSVRG